jgi:hypothetical protein
MNSLMDANKRTLLDFAMYKTYTEISAVYATILLHIVIIRVEGMKRMPLRCAVDKTLLILVNNVSYS